jgi:hypothetical protein
MRTPRGGRMGIPLCRGMHAKSSEGDCPDCLTVELAKEANRLLGDQNELMAAGLDERDRPRRRQYTPPPPVEEKPQIRRRGL